MYELVLCRGRFDVYEMAFSPKEDLCCGVSTVNGRCVRENLVCEYVIIKTMNIEGRIWGMESGKKITVW